MGQQVIVPVAIGLSWQLPLRTYIAARTAVLIKITNLTQTMNQSTKGTATCAFSSRTILYHKPQTNQSPS